MTDALSRRAFAERLALAAAAPFLLDDAEFPRSASRGGGQGERTQQPQQPQEPSALAKALAEGVRARYPDRFTPDDLTALTRGIDNRLRQIDRLYQAALTNADEPDFVYAVYRGPDRDHT